MVKAGQVEDLETVEYAIDRVTKTLQRTRSEIESLKAQSKKTHPAGKGRKRAAA